MTGPASTPAPHCTGTGPAAVRRFYVAGKAAGGEDLVRDVAGMLCGRGWEWSMDWTTVTVAKPYLDHRDVNGPVAEAMRDAVASSDLVVLVPGPDIFGALLETGIALGTGATVAVLGAGRSSVFWCLPGVHLVDDVDTLTDLAESLERDDR